MECRLSLAAFRFHGGSTEQMVERILSPDAESEVREAWTLLIAPYPEICPNTGGQWSPVARELDELGVAWVDVPLLRAELRVFTAYFRITDSRSFWNVLSLVYTPSAKATQAVKNMAAFSREEYRALVRQMISDPDSGYVDIPAGKGARAGADGWDGCTPFACHFPMLSYLHSGPLRGWWQDFVRIERAPQQRRDQTVTVAPKHSGDRFPWRRGGYFAVFALLVLSALAVWWQGGGAGGAQQECLACLGNTFLISASKEGGGGTLRMPMDGALASLQAAREEKEWTFPHGADESSSLPVVCVQSQWYSLDAGRDATYAWWEERHGCYRLYLAFHFKHHQSLVRKTADGEVQSQAADNLPSAHGDFCQEEHSYRATHVGLAREQLAQAILASLPQKENVRVYISLSESE